MSLNWTIGNIKDYKELWVCINPEVENKDDKRYELDGLTESLIYASMVLGFNQLTEQNVEQIYSRNCFAYKFGLGAGTMVKGEDGKWKEKEPSLDDFKRRIGLTTNASVLTAAAFKKKVIEHHEGRHGKM